MWLGIDVGGTFTDAVVVDQGRVVAQAKKPTTHDNLLPGILQAMDVVLAGMDPVCLERVALSTTVVTNALVQGKTDKVGLLIIPGPGVNMTGLTPEIPAVLPGYIDHRGREVAAPSEQDVMNAAAAMPDCRVFAVSGKFSVRNPRQEEKIGRWIGTRLHPQHITLGSRISGGLNFLRRTNSAYYNAAVWRSFGDFAAATQEALRQRGITAPVYILKADGGTIPLLAACEQPVEAIFTGPAASVLGIMAMVEPSGPAVSLDIGGTTTDIALWQDGVPLFAERGARVAGYPTAVRGFWLRSVGIGGDSFVRREDGMLKVGPVRHGPAMASGGPVPTVSDAMIVAGMLSFGERSRAEAAMKMLAVPGHSAVETAQTVLEAATGKICRAIEQMIDERASQPVYKVNDIVHSVRFQPETVIGVGGAAGGLVPLVARQLHAAYQIPAGAMVANAVGAATARPTLDITLRADTVQGYYTVAELGVRKEISGRGFSLADARALAQKHLLQRADTAGISVGAVETVYEEEFNLVRGFYTAGKIITSRLQIQPGVVMKMEAGGGEPL